MPFHRAKRKATQPCYRYTKAPLLQVHQGEAQTLKHQKELKGRKEQVLRQEGGRTATDRGGGGARFRA